MKTFRKLSFIIFAATTVALYSACSASAGLRVGDAKGQKAQPAPGTTERKGATN